MNSGARERQTRARSHAAAGFTLLEVMVAMAILAMGVVASMNIFSSGMASASRAKEHAAALVLAESKMTELTMKPMLEEGTDSGELEGTEYRWESTVEPYEPGADEAEGAISRLIKGADEASIDLDAARGGAPGGPAATDSLKVYEVTVKVLWPGGDNGDKSISLHTLRLQWIKDQEAER
ncbi:MAG: type II secretion system minor pseudopilin GspI [Candidatus Schekmanbacteria bacterium]|nr:type II secretion system minor pseudopilin GspI [Candidatus Schekmanbacteria bacterium]